MAEPGMKVSGSVTLDIWKVGSLVPGLLSSLYSVVQNSVSRASHPFETMSSSTLSLSLTSKGLPVIKRRKMQETPC